MLKKFIQTALLLVVLCTTATTYAQVSQAPDGIQFQALATDANGHPAAGRVIYVKDAIVAKTATGTIVYSETFKVTASSAGIFTIVLGKGTYASGVTSIANIDWANGPFFLNLKIAVEPTVPTASWNVNNEYVDLGTSQFWSVPYALYAGNVKGADGKLNTSDTAAMLKPYFTSINLKANIESPTFTGTVRGITKAMVGLGNVDNTADLDKPVSTATKAALDLKANAADVTTALDLKVDKVTGKALSTNDYTTAEKTKLAAITGTNTGDQDLSALAVAADVNAALALKANTSDVNAALDTKISSADATAALALKANTADVNAALALKANGASVASSINTINTTLNTKANTIDVNNALMAKSDVVAVNNAVAALNASLVTKADNIAVTNQLGTKEDKLNKSVNVTTDAASDTKYPSVKAVKTYVDAQVAGATIADASATEKGKIQLAGDLAGTAAAPTVPGLTLKENSSNKSVNVTTDAASDTKYPSVKAVKTYVDAQVAGATIADASATEKGKIQLAGDLAGTAAAPTVPGLALKAPIASPTFTGTVTAPTYASTPIALTYTGSNINWNPAQGLNAAITLTQNSGLNFTAAPPVGSYGTVVLTQDATGSRTITLPTIAGATNKVLGSTSTSTVALSTAANSKDILNFYFDGTSCYWNIGQGYGAAAAAASSTANLASGVTGTLPVANGGTGATTASAALTSLGAAPIASPTFTGAVTAPIYASTPQALTDASTITWDPSLGLNASVTLAGNRTLSFSTTPVVGAYGTLVINQDATGSRTITLPTKNGVTNKVLGSTSTTNIALSTAANAKDIVNFYFDGTICYWNIGQGYGIAATAPSSTANLASGVTGTLPVANGGTGAITASAALTSLGAAPIASPTFTGTVSTSALSSTSITAPTYASTPIALTYTGSNINWNPAQGLNAAITLTQNSGLNFTAAPPVGSYGTVVLTQDATGNRTITLPTMNGVTNKVLGSTSTSTVALSTVANSKDILNFYFDGTSCYWNIGQGYGSAAAAASSTANLASGVTGTLPIANGGTGATTASAALTSLGGAPLASPTFTGTVTAPIYASTPQLLTDGSTITWNPSLGLNASVTLGGNRTLSFSTTPVAGAYGTLVVTQDGIGSRTLTLPSTANKVLGSISTTTIALSTAAGAKDIINFYYDGTNCYWNIGQGYGSAAVSSTPNLTSGVTGTLAVANGGTGAATLTGLVKGNGTSALSTAVAGADYQAPLTLTTTGTGAATLSGTTLNIPTPSSGGGGVQIVSKTQRDALNTTTSGVMIFNSTINKYQGSIYYSTGYNYNYFTATDYGFSEIRPGYDLKQTFTGKGQVITSANIAVVDKNRVSNTGDFTFAIWDETYNYAIFSTTITLTGAGTYTVQIPNGWMNMPRTLPNGLCSIRISSASNTGGSADFLLNAGVPVGSLYNTYFDFLGWSTPSSPDTGHQLAVDIFPQTGLTWVDLH